MSYRYNKNQARTQFFMHQSARVEIMIWRFAVSKKDEVWEKEISLTNCEGHARSTVSVERPCIQTGRKPGHCLVKAQKCWNSIVLYSYGFRSSNLQTQFISVLIEVWWTGTATPIILCFLHNYRVHNRIIVFVESYKVKPVCCQLKVQIKS